MKRIVFAVPEPRRRCNPFSFGRNVFAFSVLSAVLWVSGCATRPLSDVVIGPDFVPKNVFKEAEKLPPTFRRVVVLPLSYSDSEPNALAGKQVLEPVLQAELTKQSKMELVFLTPEQLRLWTGRDRWDFQEPLPHDFLKTMRERANAEGILFSHLTHYSPYPPIKVGWRFKLTTATDGDVLWSADEIFDGGEEAVSNSARRYAKAHLNKAPVLAESRSILLSPSSFGQYSLAALLDTIPAR